MDPNTGINSGVDSGDGDCPTTTTTTSLCRRVLTPSVLLAVGSPVVLLFDIGLITVFLLQENWQGVLLSCIAFVAWTQIIYWFFRARTLLHPRHQVTTAGPESGGPADAPPPYEEVMKTEAPPPPYYMVVREGEWSGASHTVKGGTPSVKSVSTGPGGQREAPAVGVCGGITAPYLHHITSDEGNNRSATTSVPTDPAQVIRAPIDREVNRLAVPVHKLTPAGPTNT